MRRAATLTVLAQLWLFAAVAQEPPLATIEVTAAPLTVAEEQAPSAFATVIDPRQHAEQLETLTDALAETVGVQVRRFGGLGAFSTLSIRGSSSNQIQIYLDGIPLSRARNETVNLADLPLDNLERIEVYRGTAPVRFGSGAIGGIVNLVTRPPTGEPATDLSASYGSFDTRKVTASHSRRAGPVDVLGFVTYMGSKGDFEFVDDNGTDQNPADDFETKRHNNDFDSVEALLKASTAVTDRLRIDLTSESFFKNQGIPGPGNRNRLADKASLRDMRLLNYLRATQTGLLSDTLDLSGTVFGILERQEFADADNEIGGGNQDRRDDTSLVGGSLFATAVPWSNHLLESLVQVSHESLAPTTRIGDNTNDPNQERLSFTLAAQDQVAFFRERLIFIPTLRYEHLRDRFSSTLDRFLRPTGPRQIEHRDLLSPSIGVALHVCPWFTVKGNLGRFERAPNFSELFGTTGTVRGDLDLDAESGVNRDIGFVVNTPAWRWLDPAGVEYAYFNNDLDDLIVLNDFAQGRFKPVNIGAARIRGHELTFSTGVLGHVSLDLNYTHQDSEDWGDDATSRGKQLPLRPQDELYTRGIIRGGPAKLYYEFNFVSGNFLDRANFDEVPSRDTHTLGISLTPYQPLTLSFEVRNLTDDQIQDVGRFPLPGRSFFGTVRLTL